jgi:hypothetical protein
LNVFIDVFPFLDRIRRDGEAEVERTTRGEEHRCSRPDRLTLVYVDLLFSRASDSEPPKGAASVTSPSSPEIIHPFWAGTSS